jgi:uncharacterized membrane protein HdeD (DUF308 family)
VTKPARERARLGSPLERRNASEATGPTWLFLITGTAWLVFALLVFQWDYTTVYAVSYLFGVVAIVAGLNELLQLSVWTTGWKVAHAVLALVFLALGVWAVAHPDNAFKTLAALIGFAFLAKGIGDLVTAFRTRAHEEAWWLGLAAGIVEIALAFWVAGAFREKAILLVVAVGVFALMRGLTEFFLAFKLMVSHGSGPLRPA